MWNRLSELGDRDDFADSADFVTGTQEIASQVIGASKSIIAIWCILTENEFLPKTSLSVEDGLNI
jgi:hypothetical protein